MAIKYQDVRHDRQWKASTGLSKDQFVKLTLEFGKAYEGMFGVSMQERQSNSTSESTFKTYEDLLFFTLFSLKSDLTYEQRRQRPSDKEEQKDDYSCKKNAYGKNTFANRFPKAHQVFEPGLLRFCTRLRGSQKGTASRIKALV